MKSSYYNLFLDDIRSPINVKQAWHGGRWIEFPSQYTWTIVRSHKQFIETILREGLPARIAFDHDLSWLDQGKTDYATFKERTGYDCAKWLADYCVTNNLPLPDYMVHSFNPVGRSNIIQFLTRFQEIRPDLKIQA